MVRQAKIGRTLLAATCLSTLALSAFAAPITFTYSGTANYGYGYDYSAGTNEDRAGYTVEYNIYADDEATPDYTNSYAYAGYFDYNYSYFSVQQEVNVYDTTGTLVDSSGLFDSRLYIVDYGATSRDGYNDYIGFDAYYETTSTGKNVEAYSYVYGDGPDSLFTTGYEYDSLAALSRFLPSAFNSSYFYFNSYGSDQYTYYSGTISDASSSAASSVSAVPLPAGSALLLSGLAAFGVARRRKAQG